MNIDELSKSDKDFSDSAKLLAINLHRIGSAAKEAKVSFNELRQLIEKAEKTTSKGRFVVANALKSIACRLQRNDVREKLESLGIRKTDSFFEVLFKLKEISKSLGESERVNLFESVAGVYQIFILEEILETVGIREAFQKLD